MCIIIIIMVYVKCNILPKTFLYSRYFIIINQKIWNPSFLDLIVLILTIEFINEIVTFTHLYYIIIITVI